MSEVKKIATRESYGNALVELGKLHDDVVVLDADLAGATKTGMFKKAFPERFIAVSYTHLVQRQESILRSSRLQKARSQKKMQPFRRKN